MGLEFDALKLLHFLLILLVSSAGDLLVKTFSSHGAHLSIVFDEAAHACIAALLWSSALPAKPVPISKWTSALREFIQHILINYRPILLAGFLGCSLDVDHFIAAASLSLEGATHLARRPFGHCVEFVLLISSAIVLLVRGRKSRYAALLVGTSLFSNQLRDSTRRGLWLWSFDVQTRPLSTTTFLLVCIAISLVVSRLLEDRSFRHAPSSDTPSRMEESPV